MIHTRVVIAGGAGFVGSHLAERLLADGASVICVDNLSTGSLDNLSALSHDPRLEFIEADITRPLDIRGPVSAVANNSGDKP